VASYLRRHQSLHYYGVVVALTDCNVDIFAGLLGHYNTVALLKQQMNHGTKIFIIALLNVNYLNDN
jgi:SNF family Na+-dependent transporter